MTLAPLLAAPAMVQVHAFSAMAALGLGIVQLVAPRGTLPHRHLGRVWVVLMVTVALSSFWITSAARGHHYSYIHLISLGVLVMLPLAVLRVRRGQVAAHGRLMVSIFFGGLIIAGGATLLPGRIMGAVVFGW